MPNYSRSGNPKKMKVPSHQELRKIISEIPKEEDRVMAALLYGTAGRVSEVINITPMDMKLEKINGTELYTVNIRTLKNRNQYERKALLSIEYDYWIILILVEWAMNKGDQAYISINRQTVWKHLMKYFGKSPHCLRHYRITNLIKDLKLTARQLKKLMGWSSETPLKHYEHLFLDDVVSPFGKGKE